MYRPIPSRSSAGLTIVALAAWLIVVQFAAGAIGIVSGVLTIRRTQTALQKDRAQHCAWARKRYPDLEAQGKLTHAESQDLLSAACQEAK